MWKLVIADDERVIRETIYHLIDWASLDIEVIGLCKDGIEAYNVILDESPDIVMTDIRMPGLTGLELVREIAQTDQQMQFIILSGYEEFEYAREAMKYGVRHYLLKPCNEKKLIESIQQACADCKKAKQQKEKEIHESEMLNVIHQEAMYHLVQDGLSMIEKDRNHFLTDIKDQMKQYAQYLELDRNLYYLYYLYYMEPQHLHTFLGKLEKEREKRNRSIIFYGIYVKNTCMLFCYEKQQKEKLMNWCDSQVEIAEEQFVSLPELLESVLFRVMRYDVIYAIHNLKETIILNNQNSIRYMQGIYARLESNDLKEIESGMEELTVMIKDATQRQFLQMIGNSICTNMTKIGAYSMQEEVGFIRTLNQEQEIEVLRESIIEMIFHAKEKLCKGSQEYGILAETIIEYVKEHLGDCDLTLKKISEQCLYMNVDYVSRRFHKETGKKFSQYLTEQRINKAKELMLEDKDNKIQYIAERVGCGNNPQYFSQIFKKSEGITPGKWAELNR